MTAMTIPEPLGPVDRREIVERLRRLETSLGAVRRVELPPATTIAVDPDAVRRRLERLELAVASRRGGSDR